MRGLYSVGLAVPVGRLKRGPRRRALADLAERYGSGDVRLTPGQNVMLADVQDTRPARPARRAAAARSCGPDPSPSIRGTVSCIGVGLCDLALTDTKGDALRGRAPASKRRCPHGRSVAINWSGCPAACGNHQTADIGLQGGKARVGGKIVEVYQVFVGGRQGRLASAALPVLNTIPATEIGEVVECLVQAHADGRDLVETGQAIAASLGGPLPTTAREAVSA